MASTLSNMLPLGTMAPGFILYDTVSGEELSLFENRGDKATVLFFICNHCPFVIHVNDELVKIANDYTGKKVSFLAISSNDVLKYPDDAPHLMRKRALELKYPFPYLFDESQEVAKSYDAACTPDIYVFDKNLKLVYRGQLDDSRPDNGIPVTGSDLRHALDCVIEDKPNTRPQKPSMGCGIKWKV
ncbi:MAG TPA: thioredoxin family protein [Flavobacteriia bacterium]|nr:thioredoxin family protein [Flavobacteriia bacterium]